MEHDADATADESPVLLFDGGIPGFGRTRRFALADLTDDGMFQELVDLGNPQMSMVVASPWIFFPDYAPELPDSDRVGLALEDAGQAAVFCSVVVEDDRLAMNLRAPFVANAFTRHARQVLLDDDALPLRAPLIASSER